MIIYGVDTAVIWKTIKEDLPPLKRKSKTNNVTRDNQV